jgi:hypothetical protein
LVADARRCLVVLLAAIAGMAVLWWFSPIVRAWARTLAGHPAYVGPWVFVEHALLDTALAAAVCALLWVLLAKRGYLPPVAESLRLPSPVVVVAWGVAAGVAIAALNLALFAFLASRGELRGFSIAYVPPKLWAVAGNVLSNFYEEFVFRGFLVVTMRMVFRSTPIAVVISSLAFGFSHTQ